MSIVLETVPFSHGESNLDSSIYHSKLGNTRFGPIEYWNTEQKVKLRTRSSESSSLPESFNLSTLQFMVTSCPTRRPFEGRGRKPTAKQGSSTGLCKTRALLKVKGSVSLSGPVSSLVTGLWAPRFLSPDIVYLIFNTLIGSDSSPSSAKVRLIN